MLLSALALVIAGLVGVSQAESDTVESSANHLFYALRLIGALLVATVVPLLIDRRAHRSSRIGQ